MRNRHIHTQSLDPDFVAYIRDLEQAADRLECALVAVQHRHPYDYLDTDEAVSALRGYARVRQEGSRAYSAA